MHELVVEGEAGLWTTVKLGEVASCTLGGTPSTEVPHFWGGSVPWMASGDVHLRRIHDVPGRITTAGLAASNATLVPPPAVAVGLAGQGKTRGTVALTLCELSTNQSIALLRGDEVRLQTAYLFHNLDRRYEELRARSSGGGRGGLSKGVLDAVPLDLPPLPEQHVITEILDTLDTTIRQTEAIIEKLKQVKQGLLHDLLTRGIDANGELRPPQSEAPHLYKDSPLGWIPREWTAKPLNDLVDQRRPVVYGILMPGQGHEGGVPVVKVKDIVGGRILLDQLLLTSPAIDQEYKRSRLAPGDLLFTIRGSVGRTAFVPGQLEGANITQDTARVGITGVDARFVREYLAMPSPVRFIATHTLGVAVQGINLRDVRRIPIAVPRADEAKAIADMLDAASDRIATEALEAQKLTIAKSGLMDDLLTGRVRVTPLLEAAHA